MGNLFGGFFIEKGLFPFLQEKYYYGGITLLYGGIKYEIPDTISNRNIINYFRVPPFDILYDFDNLSFDESMHVNGNMDIVTLINVLRDIIFDAFIDKRLFILAITLILDFVYNQIEYFNIEVVKKNKYLQLTDSAFDMVLNNYQSNPIFNTLEYIKDRHLLAILIFIEKEYKSPPYILENFANKIDGKKIKMVQ